MCYVCREKAEAEAQGAAKRITTLEASLADTNAGKAAAEAAAAEQRAAAGAAAAELAEVKERLDTESAALRTNVACRDLAEVRMPPAGTPP
jgi:hypothetical protein